MLEEVNFSPAYLMHYYVSDFEGSDTQLNRGSKNSFVEKLKASLWML